MLSLVVPSSSSDDTVFLRQAGGDLTGVTDSAGEWQPDVTYDEDSGEGAAGNAKQVGKGMSNYQSRVGVEVHTAGM